MVDALVAHVGDVEQAVDTAEVDEGAVIGDVLDDAVDHLAFGQLVDQLAALFGAGFFKHGAARDDDVAATTVHLEDLERLGHVHQRSDVTHGADVDLAAGQEGHGAVEVDGEATLDAAEDAAFDALAFAEFVLELVPGGFAAGAVAAEHCFAFGVLDAVDIDFDFIADAGSGFAFRTLEFLEVDAAFTLQADIDVRHAVFDGGDGALDDAAFEAAVIGAAELLVEHFREIIARGIGCSCHVCVVLTYVCYRPPVLPGSLPVSAHHYAGQRGKRAAISREAGCQRGSPFNRGLRERARA